MSLPLGARLFHGGAAQVYGRPSGWFRPVEMATDTNPLGFAIPNSCPWIQNPHIKKSMTCDG
jgi:hypothetical protein